MGTEARPPFNHVGITVPDIYGAIDWYTAVLGCAHIMGPRVLAQDSAATAETGQVLGPRFRRAYQAHLLTQNGIGLELFQFVEPEVADKEDEFTYWRRGAWHICLTYDDLDATVRDIVSRGGRQLSPVTQFVPGRPYRLVYCQDPWGTTIELMSHPYAEVFSDWPQDGMTQPTTWLRRDGSTFTASSADEG